MATSSRAERFKYGICLNDECEMCKNKTVQQIPMRKDLICANCGKPLRECPPPSTGGNKKLFIAGGVIATAVVVCGLYFGLKSSDTKEPVSEPLIVVQEVDSTVVDTLVADSKVIEEKTVVDEPQVKEPETKQETVKRPVAPQPSWGTYTGERDGSGKPNGQGELKITRSHEINGEMAQPGESIKGVFRNGYVNMGKWYKNDGNVVVVKDIKVI